MEKDAKKNGHMEKSWDMKLFLTPVDTFLAPNGLYRKCTTDRFIV